MNPADFVRFAAAATVMGIDTLAFAPTAIVSGALLGPTHPLVSRLYRGFARVGLLGFAARVRTNGDGHLDPEARFVFAANHESHLDSLAILTSLRRHPVRFVAKAELGRVPLFGQALRWTGNVIVDRADTQRDVSALDAAQREFLQRISVLFFAEGTRSRTGQLAPFKKGAAVFALKAGLPLVPIGVHGAFAILPPGYEVKRGGTVGVSIGDPIETGSHTFEDREALTEQLREAVAHEITRARKLAEAGEDGASPSGA